MKQFHSAGLFLVIAFAALLFGTGQAQAKRGFKLFTMGSTVDEIGNVEVEKARALKEQTRYNLSKIGFQYSYFGLFWLDLWNWNGEYVLYDGNKDGVGEVITKAKAAELMGVAEKKVGKPFNYRFPYLLDILVVGALLKFVPRFIAMKKQSRSVPEFKQGDVPRWTPPAAPPAGSPPPAAGGAPPVPPPLPPE